MGSPMNIVFASDEKFSVQLATTITSILLNADKNDMFRFYVLDGGLSSQVKEKINRLKKIKDFEINYVVMNLADFKNCPICWHFSKATYFRFKIPEIIKEKKALYMDCDVLVKKSLKSLYSEDLTGFYAAVCDEFAYFDVKKQLKICVERYFNAGVMLLNIEKMRQDNIQNQAFEFVNKSRDKIVYVDQDVLNVLLEHKLRFINSIYNFQFNMYLSNVSKLHEQMKNDIVILHFASDKKPWKFQVPISMTLCYLYYMVSSGFLGDFCRWYFNDVIVNKLKALFACVVTCVR